MRNGLLLGAVAYDSKVLTIWDGFRTWFRANDFHLDFVLYSHYERQVQDLVTGHIDVAWNSPLAWICACRRAKHLGSTVQALAMRDSDRDLRSAIIVRSEDAARSIFDLRTSVIGTGALDSPQATLLPLSLFRRIGVSPESDIDVRHFDIGVGLHGDHVGGERKAVEALRRGDVDAACVLDSNLLLFSKEGLLPPGSVRVVAQTEPFDHCNMTAGPSAQDSALATFVRLLTGMSYEDSELRPLLDLEGLKQWLPARTDRYSALTKAVDEVGFYDDEGRIGVDYYQP
jgi:phosphonate transport system substrate-binding protein